jgi:hypothetical protein
LFSSSSHLASKATFQPIRAGVTGQVLSSGREILLWNTLQMEGIVTGLRASGRAITNEDRVHVSSGSSWSAIPSGSIGALHHDNN